MARVGSSQSFADAVRVEGAQRCVGRDALKARLVELLDLEESRVAMLVGPPGIGKTSLAHWLAAEVRTRGGQIGWISGEQVAPNPDAFLERMRVSRSAGAVSSLAELGRGEARDLLVLDSFECLLPLARWIFTELLDELGANTLVVLATRERIDAVERARLALHAFVELPVEPLDETDARSLLVECAVPTEHRDGILELASGHPLALRLAAERASSGSALHPRDKAHVVDELVRAFASDTPSPSHTRALFAGSVARTLDEPLLATMVGGDASELFAWLGRSSLAERTEVGISLHGLARAPLFADLQRRDPELLRELQCRLVDALVPRMLVSDLSTAHDLVLQGAYAQRNRPEVAHYGPAAAGCDFSVVPLREAPLEGVRDAVLRFEGPDGLCSFERWLPRSQLSSAIVHDDGRVAAFQLVIGLPYEGVDAWGDPLIEAAWRCWREREPSPEEGELHLFRWFMDTEQYHVITPALGHLFPLGPLLTILRMGEIIHLAFVNSPSEFWGALAPQFQLDWRPEHTATFAGRDYSLVYGSIKDMAGPHWGKVDAASRTLRDYLMRHFGLPTGDFAPAPASASAFTRDALQKALPIFLTELVTPESHGHGLLASVLRERGVASDRPAMRAWVDAGIEELAGAQRTARSAQVLRATYFAGSSKQLAVASELGVPFGTYRYQLRKAVDALAVELWHRLEAT